MILSRIDEFLQVFRLDLPLTDFSRLDLPGLDEVADPFLGHAEFLSDVLDAQILFKIFNHKNHPFLV